MNQATKIILAILIVLVIILGICSIIKFIREDNCPRLYWDSACDDCGMECGEVTVAKEDLLILITEKLIQLKLINLLFK